MNPRKQRVGVCCLSQPLIMAQGKTMLSEEAGNNLCARVRGQDVLYHRDHIPQILPRPSLPQPRSHPQGLPGTGTVTQTQYSHLCFNKTKK